MLQLIILGGFIEPGKVQEIKAISLVNASCMFVDITN